MNNSKRANIELRTFLSRSDSICKPGIISDFPVISIVMPSYNQGCFIEKTILSVLNQQYPATELIIIDGGSTDETISILKKYDSYIAHWSSEPDQGQSDALNKGFARANGDIFGWINSDDIYLPGAFMNAAQVFRGNLNVKVVYGNWYTIDARDRIVDVHYALKARTPRSPFENMDAYNQSMFWRRSAHNRFGSFEVKLNQLIDNYLILNLLINEGPERFFKMDDFIGGYRIHESQKTDLEKSGKCYFDEEEYLIKKFNFGPGGSIITKCHRIRYRFAQLMESIYYGGAGYTLRRFVSEYKRRGKFI